MHAPKNDNNENRLTPKLEMFKQVEVGHFPLPDFFPTAIFWQARDFSTRVGEYFPPRDFV